MHMDERNEKLTENRHTIDVVREIIDNSDEVHEHAWTASRDDREQTGATIYSVKFALVREQTCVVIVEGYNHTYAHIGHTADCVDIFNSEVNKSHEDADRINEAHYADEFNLV
jgi:hypothetical protein